MSDFINSFKNSGSFSIVVKPSQKKSFVDFVDGVIIVSVKAKPENNKANIEVENLLSKLFGKQIKIVRGKTSNKKIVKFL